MYFEKRENQCSTMELIVHDVVEQILERLPPKSLVRFKSVSKRWKSTIESPIFQHRHLIRHPQNSKSPDVLMIKTDYKVDHDIMESIMTLELESSISRNIPIPWENNHYIFCQNSCDGLICFYNDYDSVIIFNPTTRWYRTLPQSTYQQSLKTNRFCRNLFGFGKDEINGLYKLVWLYNSADGITRCEVFDFNINAWRFIEPSSPLRLPYGSNPVYLNGSLYWLIEENEEEITSVLSLNLHTEIFEIVCEAPYAILHTSMILCNLNDNLCVLNTGSGEEIWWLNTEEKTWEILCYTEILKICGTTLECDCDIWPVALLGENNKLLLYNFSCCEIYNRKND